jgi:uncharacterized protein (DUF58 family)
VNLHWFSGDLMEDLGGARGKSQFHSVLDFLARPPASAGVTRLLPSLRTFAQRARRRGLVFIISDFFDPEGFEEALARLRHAQFEVQTIQMLDPAELNPQESGDLRLEESESGAALEVTATDALLRRYRAEVSAFLDRLSRYCRERGIGHAQASTAVPFEDLVLRVLRDGVMLR